VVRVGCVPQSQRERDSQRYEERRTVEQSGEPRVEPLEGPNTWALAGVEISLDAQLEN
jgi:hypothetical protein